MKISVFFVFCMALPTIMCISEEMKALAATMRKNCMDESGVDEALIDKVNKEKIIEDDEKLKCYIKCLMVKIGCMNDQGVVDAEALIAFAPEEVREKLAPAIRACGTKVGVNSCENAWLTNKCYQENEPDEYFLI